MEELFNLFHLNKMFIIRSGVVLRMYMIWVYTLIYIPWYHKHIIWLNSSVSACVWRTLNISAEFGGESDGIETGGTTIN